MDDYLDLPVERDLTAIMDYRGTLFELTQARSGAGQSRREPRRAILIAAATTIAVRARAAFGLNRVHCLASATTPACIPQSTAALRIDPEPHIASLSPGRYDLVGSKVRRLCR